MYLTVLTKNKASSRLNSVKSMNHKQLLNESESQMDNRWLISRMFEILPYNKRKIITFGR